MPKVLKNLIPQGHLPPFQRLLWLLRPERVDMWSILLYAIGIGAFTLVTPIIAMVMVNAIALGMLAQQLIVLCGALLIALSIGAGLSVVQTIAIEFVQRRLFVRISTILSERLPRIDLKAFDRQHGPELVNRFFDVLTVQKAGANLLLDGISIVLQVTIGLMLLGFYHSYLLVFDIILVISLSLLLFVLSKNAVKTAIKESILKFNVAGWMEELAHHSIAFKMAGGPKFASDKGDRLTNKYLAARSEHFRILMRQIIFSLTLQVIANVILLGLGGYLVSIGELTLGQLVAAEIIVTLVVATFSKFGKQLESFYDLLAAVEKLGHLLDLPVERDSGTTSKPQKTGANIIFHDITFFYNNKLNPTLKNFSLEIKPNERVALMGPNGSGKSALMDLLYGLRQPNHGWVEFDGMDLRDLELQSYREQIAMVRRIEVFGDTLASNVHMGRENISIADVSQALKMVGLLDIVLEFPDGLETLLWPGGNPLSLGQANRLMLARALVGSPRLLILDETLDHMDKENRRKIIDKVLEPNNKRTLIILTHSKEVADLCDRTILLNRRSDTTSREI